MTFANQSQINRLVREIADLRQTEARETKKEADIQAKINRATEAMSRTSNASTRRSKSTELERATRGLAATQKKRADVAGRIAGKSKDLSMYQERQAHEEERERKKVADEQKRLIREREQHEKKITHETRLRANLIAPPNHAPPTRIIYDFFISHASEDKDAFVRELAEALETRGAKVWYDEFTLKVGDSLRREVDQGLTDSRYGVVVLSRHFFQKEWPQKELGGLVSLEGDGAKRILPIWHEISKKEVTRHSPTLADKVALNTSLKSTDEIADELCRLIEGWHENDSTSSLSATHG